MLALYSLAAAIGLTATKSLVQAAPCTAISDDYPFFMYAFNDGKPIFTRSIAFEPSSKGGSLGLAINYEVPTGFYPATFNITKQNLISQYNNIGHAQLSDPLVSGGFVSFSTYNAKKKNPYGLFGLQQYNKSANTIGEDGCIITVNHEVVPFYLCPGDDDSTNGALFVTYQPDATRYCIDIQLIAISEG